MMNECKKLRRILVFGYRFLKRWLIFGFDSGYLLNLTCLTCEYLLFEPSGFQLFIHHDKRSSTVLEI